MSYHAAWSPELVAALAAPFPASVVQQLQKGGTKIDFVPWHQYVRKLNDLVGPGWSMGTPIIHEAGGKLVMGIPVTILGTTRVNFGDEDEEKDDYGTAATNAFSQSFKRTCALFGMGLDMYLKSKPARQPANRDAPAPSDNNGKAIHQQLNAIAKFFDTREISIEDREQLTVETNSGTMSYGRAAEWIYKLDKLPKVTR